ncbi:hypothetical protein ACHQM5_017832 [Ranunculus cassubicifolius]
MVCKASYSSPSLGFLLKSFGTIMNCLFRCFCLTNEDTNTTTQNHSNQNPSQIKKDHHPVSKNRLASLYQIEAKFLKSCGALLETPIEIRKTSRRVTDDVLPHDEHSETSKYHSWLPITSMDKLRDGIQNESDSSPVPNKETDTSIDKDVILFTPKVPVVTNEYKNKSVRFELDSSDTSSISSSGENTKQLQSKQSPYPTPMKLSDEMQTPGTVYPIHSEYREKAHIRSQYVYNVLNPIQNFSQLKALQEEDKEYYNDKDVDSPEHKCVSQQVDEEAVNASLSQWLKPPSISPKKCVSDMDRPIIGTVAAHWNKVEPTSVSPKWFDGNGIPNSTHKYNENQTVSWHATPFEERLEKALSNESIVTQRKRSIEPIVFAENEEDDTAVSGLRPSKLPESVVSF